MKLEEVEKACKAVLGSEVYCAMIRNTSFHIMLQQACLKAFELNLQTNDADVLRRAKILLDQGDYLEV